MYRWTYSVIYLLVAVYLMGCASSGDPTTPVGQTIMTSHRDAVESGHQCWGSWDVAIDRVSGEIETTPLRSADFNANVVKFLQPPVSPVNMVTMKVQTGSDIPAGYLVLDITLRHPFFSLSQFRGFDVRGIILTEGGTTGIHDPSVSYSLPTGTRLINPDGYTRWWNQPEFTSVGTILGYTEGNAAQHNFTSTTTLNPYKLYANGLESDAPLNSLDPDSRATFSTKPGINSRRYKIQFDISGTPVYRFKYSIDASWSLPDPSFAPDYAVEAYDMSANCQEPYLIEAPIFEEMPYYLNSTTYGGDAVFQLTIGDWQATTPEEVLGQLSHVWVESPTLLDAPIDVLSSLEFVSSTHPTQATFRCTISNNHPTSLTGQQFLITAESANPSTYAPQISGDPNAFAWPASPLAAYAFVNVPVSDQAPVETDKYYVVGLPDWCALTEFCTYGADNFQLITNIVKWDLPGLYNDNSTVKWWEGHVSPTPPYSTYEIEQHVIKLGYTFARTSEPVFDPSGCRVVIVVWVKGYNSTYPVFTDSEVADMKKFVKDGGILCFLIENPNYFDPAGMDDLFPKLEIPLGYAGYAQPPSDTTVTSDITPNYLTTNMLTWQYWTCGAWTLESPDCVSLIRTPTGEHVVVIAPIDVN